jgi:hypothetical protein
MGKLLLLTLWVSYNVQDEAVNPLTAWEHIVLIGDTVVPPYPLIQYPKFQLSAVNWGPKNIGKLQK